MSRPKRSPGLELLAALALLFVALGLPRHLIVCDHGDGGHVEFQHAIGACCDEPTGAASSSDDEAPRTPHHRVGCKHTGFAIDCAPAPAPLPIAIPPLAPNVAATFASFASDPTTPAAQPRPPGGAPPRYPPTIASRPTTRLLL